MITQIEKDIDQRGKCGDWKEGLLGRNGVMLQRHYLEEQASAVQPPI
jgi:hypothetical protein